MKTFLKYVMGLIWAISASFSLVFFIGFALWLMIKKAPALIGWSAFGTIFGAMVMLVGTIILILVLLWELFVMGRSHKFVLWLHDSENQKMLEIYRTWLNEQSERM